MRVKIEFECDSLARESGWGAHDARYDLHVALAQAERKIFEQLDRPVATVCTAPEAADTLRDANGQIIGFVKLEM